MNKKELVELFKLALDYNCDTFHVFFDWGGHCDYLSVRVSMGGWKKCGEQYTHTEISSLAQLKTIKFEHDKLYAPENIEATKEAERLAKIAELQKQIKELS